jgi:peptidoglycan hydrolase-like protein with peptidoglycan-binding domain
VIFSRDGGSGGRHAAGDGDRRDRTDRREDSDQAAPRTHRGAPPAFDGPYDIEDAPTGHDRVDLGSLQIPSVEGVEVRVQANADGVIQQVVLGYQESVLQLGVFAAPRSEGIWDEVRTEIRKQLFADGVAAEEADGDYGVELRARVRQEQGFLDIRFIGVDGPRWMVRAVYQGKAAADPSSAGPLARCLAGLVVNRGKEAMPVREALPLRLPKEIADQARAQAEQQQAQAQAQPPASPPPTSGAPRHAAPPLAAPPAAPPVAPPAAEPVEAAAGRRRPSPRPRRAN